MLDNKMLHSRCARVQIAIFANFGQSFAGRRVDELALALNTTFLEHMKDALCFFPPPPLPLG